jgi:hypothetical protein
MEWEYERHVEHEGKTYHVWSAQHREGYTAYQLTLQPDSKTGLDYVKPTGNAHFTSLEAITRRTGIEL